MKEVKLNRKKKRVHDSLNLVALVDDEDYERVNQYYWQVKIHGTTYYAKRAVVIDGKRTSESMHRFILGVNNQLIEVDHRDNNGLNNQKNNLRECVHILNSVNCSKRRFDKRSALTSIYKGVSLDHNRYAARIRVDGKLIYIGGFKTEEDAAVAYNNAAIKYFGEYANINSLPQNQKI